MAATLARSLALAMLLAPAVAGAAVGLSAVRTEFPAPFVNGITAWATPSSVEVKITNTGDQIIRSVAIQMPNIDYTATGGSAPSAVWTVSYTSQIVTFATACASPGIAPGDAVTFVISMTPPQGQTTADTTTSPFQVTGSTAGTATCGTTATGTGTFTAPVKALYIYNSTVTRVSATRASVTWTVKNLTTVTLNSISVVPVVTPSAGVSGTCGTLTSLRSQRSGTITCTYDFTANGTFTFDANAKDGPGTSTAVGASAGSFTVGPSTAVWTKAVVVKGLSSNTLALTVANGSSASITRVDVTNASSTGWTLSTGSATNNLSYSSSSTAADVIFTGSLAAGAESDLGITFSAVPSVTTTTPYTFGVKLTFASGSPVNTTQTVLLVVPVPDVAGLTVRADSSGQVLAWTNTSGNGSTHDGVVVFRSPAGTAPATPVHFTVYTAGSDGAVYADGAGSTVASVTDGTAGNYNYRVCNHDAYFVYSGCSTGFWNNAGWLDSGTYPTGGWVQALGGNALVRAGLLPGNRIAQANNAPSVAVFGTASGDRSFAPVPIASLPSTYTPAMTLADGKTTVVFAADQAGNITATDVGTEKQYWKVTKTGESFMAGVSGISRAYASTAFKAAYPMDVLLLGSTTGTVFAIDTTSGATLWTVAAGAPIYGLVNYDALTDLFWVPTAGAGVKAYTMAGSSPKVAAVAAPGWANPEPTGSYRFHCVRTLGTATITCINTSGEIRFMDKLTGALKVPKYATGVSSPTALVRVSGTAATPGLVVSSATTVRVLAVNDATFAVTVLGTWTPPTGVRLSTPAVYADKGYLVIGGGKLVADQDCRLYRVSLANAAQLARSPQITTQATGLLLAQPVYDTASKRYLFGTDDGHLWAVPEF